MPAAGPPPQVPSAAGDIVWAYEHLYAHAVASLSNFWLSADFWIIVGLIPLTVGISLIFWGCVGLLRILVTFYSPSAPSLATYLATTPVFPHEVAVIIPAHNEELVIADTIRSLGPIANPRDVHIVSDGSSDGTVRIAQSSGANVLDLQPSHGKAGALEACIEHFRIVERYKVVLLLDADTRLAPDYLIHALPHFDDPRVIAVAGYAKTIWNAESLSPLQKLFVLHRDRIYFLSQALIKFGQTWKYTNVTHIVPGFASMYRTSVLGKVTMNPKGVVIEDFNMTFEMHHKQLGIIAHDSAAVAYTQDPDNWDDYYRQIRRWHLGLWQTIRLHGFWPSAFWAALTLTLLEVVLGSLIFLIIPGLLIAGVLFKTVAFFFYQPLWVLWILRGLPSLPFFFAALGVMWLADYALTMMTAVAQKREEYLAYGALFPILRFLDAVAFLSAIPKAFLAGSSGRWISPTRRANG